jgi:DUF4097 and DUF4098 domain-containing protein YvlB
LAHSAFGNDVTKRAPADPRGEVEIVNVAGEVHVLGWEKPEVQVDADLGSGVERLEFSTKGPRTTIHVVLPSGGSRSGASDLTVRAPQDSSLIVHAVSAQLRVTGLRGAQRLQTLSGSIQTEIWGEDFEANTVSGDVTVRGHGGRGPARIVSVSGDVDVSDIGPELELETVSGDMRATLRELTRARLKTTNGDLEIETRLASGARLDAEAINGDLRFAFEGPINAAFDVESFNGDIDNCFGPKPKRARSLGPGLELRFTEGKDDGRVRLKTLNGGIDLCRKD